MEEINLDKVTIFQALPMIMLEFGGMKKMTAQERMDRGLVTDTGITYSYRGIDQLAGKVQPLFGKYRISIFVNVTSYTSVPYMRKTKFGESQWYRDEVAVEYTLADQFGTKVVNCVRGIGDDNSDKGYNKAMTNSFKNLLLRILCIGDPQDDIDNNQNQYYNQYYEGKAEENAQQPQQAQQAQQPQAQTQNLVNNIYEIYGSSIQKIIDYLNSKGWSIEKIENMPARQMETLIKNKETIKKNAGV